MQPRYSPYRPHSQPLRVDLVELTDRTFMVCVTGQLSPEDAEKILPRHAECVATDSGMAAIVHVRADQVRPLLDRLDGRRAEIGLSSLPKAWTEGLGL